MARKTEPNKPEVFLFNKDDFVTLELELNYTQGQPVEETPDYFNSISAHKCETCGQIIILNSEARFDHNDDREMRWESFYYIDEDRACPNCGRSIKINFQISYYAFCWDIDSDNDGVKNIWVEGLDWLAQKYYEEEIEGAPKDELINELKQKTKYLLARSERDKVFILIVEGKDDIFVWQQFLVKQGIPKGYVEVKKYGGGGADEAIKAAKFFTGLRTRLIPHKLILDSDNNSELTSKKLRENRIRKEHVSILKQKEIECYLLDYPTISRLLDVDLKDLEGYTAELRSDGKEKLDAIFKRFYGHAPDHLMKGLIAKNMAKIPDEILPIILDIRSSLEM